MYTPNLSHLHPRRNNCQCKLVSTIEDEMASDNLPFGLVFGREQASGYRCSEQYEWQHLALRKREQATREQSHCGATLNHPQHSDCRDRVEDSVVATEIPHQVRGHDLHSHGETLNDRSCRRSFRGTETKDLVAFSHNDAETEESFAKWDRPLDRTGPLESKRHRCNTSPSYCVKRTEGEVPSLDRVCKYAKGADGHMRATERLDEYFSSNQGSSTQIRNYQDLNLPSVYFSATDKARHRSYMEKFNTYNKREGCCLKDLVFNTSDNTSVGGTCYMVQGRAHPKKAIDEFHHEQLHRSPCGNFIIDHLVSGRNCRNAHEGKMSRRQCAKHDLQKRNFNGTSVKTSNRKRHGDHLDGQRAERNIPSENQSKESCYPKKDWQSYPHGVVSHNSFDLLRNDNREGNTKKMTKGGQNGESGMLSSKYRSKSVISSNGPKQCEGSNNIKLESDKKPSLVVCTKKTEDMKSEGVLNGKLQDAPITHVGNGVVMKESDNTSPSELIRDCLIIWRRLKKDSCAEAENIRQTNTNGTVQTSKMSVSRRLRNGRPTSSGIDYESSSTSGSASVSSESDDESNGPFENSEQCKGVILSCEVQKCSKGRAERESEQPFKSLSGNNCKKSPQNTVAEKELICNQNVPPETNPCEIMHRKEQDNLSCCWNGCSDTTKEPVAPSHPESSVQEKVTQHGTINDHLDARRKYELVVGCEIEKTLEADGAKSGEQITSLSTVPKLLDKKAVALCSMDDDSMKVNLSVCSNQDSEITCFSAAKLDKGTAGKFLEKPINLSMGSDCGGIHWGAMDCNILRTKQEHSQHADSEQDMHHKESEEDYEPSQALKVASNQQFDSDRDNPCTTRQADWNSCSLIPDLNSLPSMNTDEELMPFEKVDYLLNEDGTKPQNDSKSLSAASCEPTPKEPNRQPEPSELIGGICEKEGANRFQSPNSHSGPSQLSIVEESSMSIDAFKCALCEFIKNSIKPLWEDGLLSREVHKIIVRKAVDKVTTVLGSKVPLTEIAICRFLLDESQNLEKLVQDYLDVYLGKEVLKKKHSQ